MIVGYKPDHNDHDQAFTNLLQTAQKCNVKLHYDKIQYKQDEVEFFGETYITSGHKPSKDKVSSITAAFTNQYEADTVTHWYDKLLTQVLFDIVRAC